MTTQQQYDYVAEVAAVIIQRAEEKEGQSAEQLHVFEFRRLTRDWQAQIDH